jgi:hypothetical protein
MVAASGIAHSTQASSLTHTHPAEPKLLFPCSLSTIAKLYAHLMHVNLNPEQYDENQVCFRFLRSAGGFFRPSDTSRDQLDSVSRWCVGRTSED